MKKIIILLLLAALMFVSMSFSAGGAEVSGGPEEKQITEFARGLPEDFEAMRRESKKIRDLLIKKRNELLDGKEAVVRIYDNWEEDRTEYKERYVQLEGNEIILDFDDVSEDSFVVALRESQDDENVRKYIYDYIYASRYKKGLTFKLSGGGSFPYTINFQDAIGKPLSGGIVKIFLFSKELGKESRILVREVELDETGVFKGPSTNGELDRFYVQVSRPGNYGYFETDSEALDFHRLFFSESTKTLRMPWMSEGTKGYEASIFGIVVDDTNQPISDVSIKSNAVRRPDGEIIRGGGGGNNRYEILTDEEGFFEFYLPTENNEYIPMKSEYFIEAEAPKELGLMRYDGKITNGSEHTIKLNDYGYYHTFVFRDKDGPISDFERLKHIRLVVYREEGGSVIYEYKDWSEGGYFPAGFYKAESYGDFEFKRLEVTKDSPEELIFEFKDEIVYSGKVVNGVTKEPIKGAFVIAKKGYVGGYGKNFSYITTEQWGRLHSLGDAFSVDKKLFDKFQIGGEIDEDGFATHADEKDFPEEYGILLPVGRFCDFSKGVRTNSEGKFEMRVEAGGTFYSFLVFEEDYLGVELLRQFLSPDSENHYTLPVIPLFPSAKVLVDLVPKGKGFNVFASWIIDVNNLPEWAGRPGAEVWYGESGHMEELNVTDTNEDFELERSYGESSMNVKAILFYMVYDALTTNSFSFFGIPVRIYRTYEPTWAGTPDTFDPNEDIVWLNEPFEEPREDPNRVPSFYEVYTEVFCDFTYQEEMYSKRGCIINVPAGMDLKLRIDKCFNTAIKWDTYFSGQIPKLKQGQTLDLGVGELKVAPKVFVKVVDSVGKPLEGIAVEHWYKKVGRVHTEKSNKEGVAAFYVRYNCYGKFIVGSEKDGEGLYEAIAYKMGGAADAGGEFTMTLSTKILDHLYKK